MSATERRITQVGNSLGVTLPYTMLQQLNILKGDEVNVEFINNQIIIKKIKKKIELPEGLTEDFFNILNEEMEAHHEILKGLVNR